jgi:hypothetical protein
MELAPVYDLSAVNQRHFPFPTFSVFSTARQLAPHGRLPPCSGNLTSGKEPVITSLAGFESSACLDGEKPVITSLAGFELAEPRGTEGAAFAGASRPQPPGVSIAIPADLK